MYKACDEESSVTAIKAQPTAIRVAEATAVILNQGSLSVDVKDMARNLCIEEKEFLVMSSQRNSGKQRQRKQLGGK